MRHFNGRSFFQSRLRCRSLGNRRRSRACFSISLLLLSIFQLRLRAEGCEGIGAKEQQIELIIKEFSRRLGITQKIIVSIVSGDKRLASVRPASENLNEFEISFDPAFVQTLDDLELTAAVAHELGHIWIYTHFPYLQTEALANQQALKLVSRNDLDKVYEKVWRWNARKQNPVKVFGSPVDAADTGGQVK